MCKICVNQWFMLLVRLSVNSKLLAVNFWRSQSYTWIFHHVEGWRPNPCTVQGSAVFERLCRALAYKLDRKYVFWFKWCIFRFFMVSSQGTGFRVFSKCLSTMCHDKSREWSRLELNFLSVSDRHGDAGSCFSFLETQFSYLWNGSSGT